MTAIETPVAIPALPALADGGEPCLRLLIDAADAADRLGIATDVVRAAHADALQRTGFPADAYVLALVGGTGVGKSSLLNALAGETISMASVRRPTTSRPVAWIPADDRDDLGPILAWLGVDEIREHHGHDLGPVAILDLPDMDSVESEHRAKVEAILPRVDAVMWVTDPEKYHDAVLHDDFLRIWLRRLARQVVVINKADRLGTDDGLRVRSDLELDLDRSMGRGNGRVPVLLTSAAPHGDSRTGGSGPQLDDLRRWLSDGVAAKAIVRARVAATSVELAHGLARHAGVDPSRPLRPYLDAAARSAAIEDAAAAVLRAVDLPGLERQAEAATRARARSRGAGPLGRVTSFLYRASGRETSHADPEGYLMRWRERGALTPAVEAIRAALAPSLYAATPAVRPVVAAALEPGELRRGLERAVDRAVVGLESFDPPTSRWWSFIGLLQTLATAGIVLSAAWVVVWILGGPGASTVQIPVLGTVPTPFATLVVFLIAGYLLARSLGMACRVDRPSMGARDARSPRRRGPLRGRDGEASGRSTRSRNPGDDCGPRPPPSIAPADVDSWRSNSVGLGVPGRAVSAAVDQFPLFGGPLRGGRRRPRSSRRY